MINLKFFFDFYKKKCRIKKDYFLFTHWGDKMSVEKKYNKTSKKIKVTFRVEKKAAQDAENIFLLCEHNGWDPIELTKQKKGDFKVDVEFDEDSEQKEFQYRFRLVLKDGVEVYDNDWDADYYAPNPFGGENSVVDLTKNIKKTATK